MAKRLSNKDFPVPKKIEDDDWQMICKTAGILKGDQQRLKAQINNLVDALARWIRNDRKLPDRTSDREQVKEILSHIEAAAAQTAKLGPAGHLAFKAISPFVASMLAAQWMSECFPYDDTPRRSCLEESIGLRPGPRSISYFIEEQSHEARFEFVRQQPVKTMNAALQQIGKGLGEVLHEFDWQPRAKGGQEPLVYRHYALINLIEMWHGMGKEPSSGPKSVCTAFCESVVAALGWPTQGLSSAMPDALDHWRHLP